MPTTLAELDVAARAAASAAPILAAAGPEERVRWLTAVASSLDAATDELVALAAEETHLDTGRLRGEVARTTGQLRLFAEMVREGSYLEATIDHADAGVTPPRPDLRRILVPIGPVAVYAASNFPFAFSVAGGDTASALAVGCPVIVKAHDGHLRTSLRVAEIVREALIGAGAPDGSFAVVTGREAGVALVQHPAVRAAGFTGSLGGGRALFDLAASRPDPIPFYGELGSVNPVVLTPAAVAARGEELARGLGGSFTLGSGQFCTKPGVVFVPAGSGFDGLLAAAVPEAAPAALLTSRIASAFAGDIADAAADDDVHVVAGSPSQEAGAATPVVLRTTAAAVRERGDELLRERFGPTTLLVDYADDAELHAALDAVEGSLTATLHAEEDEDVDAVVALLATKAGRVLFGGWPTGVAVTWSQQHGGPWPATTSIHTSVGVTASRRFQRPLTFQDAPAALLPEALRDENPLGIPRRVDGRLLLQR